MGETLFNESMIDSSTLAENKRKSHIYLQTKLTVQTPNIRNKKWQEVISLPISK